MENKQKEGVIMKKQTIVKIVISVILFIIVMCLEIGGLTFLQDDKILFCSSKQSAQIKEELSHITGAMPATTTYSVKVMIKNGEEMSIYYMSNGQINNYELKDSELSAKSQMLSYINTDGIEGKTIYYAIIITTAILLLMLITYLFVSKKPLKGIIKLGYFILSLLVFLFLLCVIPLLSKNHGGDLYYYSIVIGSFLIGLLYGYKNKIFFLPTLVMVPIYYLATWFNYSNGMLWIDDFCSYFFLNFIGALTGRIIEKNKGIKKKHFLFYAIITLLFVLGIFLTRMKTRTITSLLFDFCKLGLVGISFSIVTYVIYWMIGKIPTKRKKSKENSNPFIIELLAVIILILVFVGINLYCIRPHSYLEANLQSYSQSLEEQYSYRILQGRVYVTTDEGDNWIEVPASFENISNTSQKFSDDSYYMDRNKLIFETNSGETIGLIYSDDNGVNWNNSAIEDTNGYIVYMKFFDKNNGIAMICYGNEIGQREHLRASITLDGGKTWTTQKEENSSVRINRGAKIEFSSMEEGKIENISYDGSKTVYITQDAGKTWEENR